MHHADFTSAGNLTVDFSIKRGSGSFGSCKKNVHTFKYQNYRLLLSLLVKMFHLFYLYKQLECGLYNSPEMSHRAETNRSAVL